MNHPYAFSGRHLLSLELFVITIGLTQSVGQEAFSFIIMAEYELTYFNARGLAEPIRLLLSYVGADWKDNRIPTAGPGTPLPEDVKLRK